MADLLAHIRREVENQHLLPPNSGVVAAVSGGLDSMVLLHLLYDLAGRYRWRLVVAHFHHGLRGCEATADQRLVRATAKRLKLRFVTERGNVKRYAAAHGLSVEMAGRALRHRFLARAARRCGCLHVALAHHADDQVETFFLRLLRGAAGAGLAGMRASAPSPEDPRVLLVRPLLALPRAALLEYAKAHQIPFREDRSNSQLDFLRNRIRHRLLPGLRREFQPALEAAVLRSMSLIAAEADLVTDLASRWLDRSNRPIFARLHTALQRKVIQLQLARLGLPVSHEWIESLRLAPDRPIVPAPGQQVWRDQAGKLHTRRRKPARFGRRRTTVVLEGRSGEAVFGRLRLKWLIRPARSSDRLIRSRRRSKARGLAGLEFFDADRIGPAICLRHWAAGDRFQPIGQARSAKLQDLFTNAKVPREQRHRLVVATRAAGDLFWVEGLRIGELCKLTPSTKRVLVLVATLGPTC